MWPACPPNRSRPPRPTLTTRSRTPQTYVDGRICRQNVSGWQDGASRRQVLPSMLGCVTTSSSLGPDRGVGRPRETVVAVVVWAVNVVLRRASNRHGELPCRARVPELPGRHGPLEPLASCEEGCFDDAATLLGPVLAAVERRAGEIVHDAALRAYARDVAASQLAELGERRRAAVGIPHKIGRLATTRWVVRALPDPADRELFLHMLTWLGSTAPAVGDTGWPYEGWAARHGLTVEAMTAWVARVLDRLREWEPRRYEEYVRDPLAAKPATVACFSAITYGDSILPECDRSTGAPFAPPWQGGRSLWREPPFTADPRARVLLAEVRAVTREIAARHGAGEVAVSALCHELRARFRVPPTELADGELAALLRGVSRRGPPQVADNGERGGEQRRQGTEEGRRGQDRDPSRRCVRHRAPHAGRRRVPRQDRGSGPAAARRPGRDVGGHPDRAAARRPAGRRAGARRGTRRQPTTEIKPLVMSYASAIGYHPEIVRADPPSLAEGRRCVKRALHKIGSADARDAEWTVSFGSGSTGLVLGIVSELLLQGARFCLQPVDDDARVELAPDVGDDVLDRWLVRDRAYAALAAGDVAWRRLADRPADRRPPALERRPSAGGRLLAAGRGGAGGARRRGAGRVRRGPRPG